MMEKSNAVKIILVLLIVFGFSCEQKELSIQLINTLDFDRKDAPVVILSSKLNISIPLITDKNGLEIPYQLDDLNGDGSWDELFLLIDIDANDTINLRIESTEKVKTFEPRVHIQFAAKDGIIFDPDTVKRLPSADTKITSQHFQMEGPAWENENVGFRNYFDGRNGMDVFGKQTSDLVLSKAGINGQNYHALDDWGMDILKVGNSLGAGAIALAQNDSIYRWDGSGEAGYTLIANGPLRASFELTFSNWPLENDSVNVTHQISIMGGTHYYQSSVNIESANEQTHLVAGIVNLHSDTLFTSETNRFVLMSTHDRQAENQAYLGMGLLLPKTNYLNSKKAPEKGSSVVDTYQGFLKLEPNTSTEFYFITGWQNQESQFEEQVFFDKMMKRSALEIESPVLILINE